MRDIKKVLIANRGEIAVRIMKTLSAMDIASVAIYAFDDAKSLFVSEADQAIQLTGSTLAETYLNSTQIIQIAKSTNCDAIHPGYGFLSENANFANACENAGLIFIGPPLSAIELMGDKVASRKFAEKHSVPLLKGITGSNEELLAKKNELIYPVIIKASAGGGGKGMRVVYQSKDLETALISTSREAESYFGNGEVFIERFIENPRHIEVQVLGDQHGNLIHLYERECTIQRRHQKIIEEAPSITLSNDQRESLTSAAILLSKAANYYSAGTVEFIVDEQLNFYFMEMNTRVQVEHPVTELVTDIDIVEQQIKIAEGQVLQLSQSDIQIDGHAVECRIYAEDPSENFRPSPGKINYYSQPDIEFTRVDTALLTPQVISDSYDPMISKIITWGENRHQAITHMLDALDEYIIRGVPHNITFLKTILSDSRFQNNNISTNYCQQFTEQLLANYEQEKLSVDILLPILAFLHHDFSSINKRTNSVWEEIGFFRNLMEIPLKIEDTNLKITNFRQKENSISFNLSGDTINSTLLDQDEKGVEFTINNNIHYADVHALSSNTKVILHEGFEIQIKRLDVLDDSVDYQSANQKKGNLNQIVSPIPGTVIELLVKEGDTVTEGQALIIVEAMKMENTLVAARDGIVKIINNQITDKVKAGEVLIELKEVNEE